MQNPKIRLIDNAENVHVCKTQELRKTNLYKESGEIPPPGQTDVQQMSSSTADVLYNYQLWQLSD